MANLPRLPRDVPLVDENGLPTAKFQFWWQTVVQKVEELERRIVELEP